MPNTLRHILIIMIIIMIMIIIIIIIIIIIVIIIICNSPTSTKPVGLTISYIMVCRLKWSALGK